MGNYNELKVWNKSVDLAIEVYLATAGFPKDEIFGPRMQMRRAAVSVPSNLTEGAGRLTAKDYRRFVLQTRGSLLELETQVVICERLEFINAERCAALKAMTGEIGRMLNGLLRYLTPDA